MGKVIPPLRDYQIKDLGMLMARPRLANLSKPGTGKTPSACIYTWWLWHTHKVKTIWVQPVSLARKNLEELLRFTEFTPEDVVIVEGTPKVKMALLEGPAKVYLISPVSLQKFVPYFMERRDIGALIADEVQLYWANWESQRTQAALQLVPKIPRFLALTGTLISGKYSSAYPVIHMIEPRFYGSNDIFCNYHEVVDEYGRTVGWGNPDRLTQVLAQISIFHSYKEVYGDKPLVMMDQQIDLSPAHKDMYSEWEDLALLEFQDGTALTTESGAVKALRARQILAHPEIWSSAVKETRKDEWVIDFLKNTPGPVVMFSVFNPEQERLATIAAKCKRKVEILNSHIGAVQRARIDAAFRARSLDCLVCSPLVAGVGFNWHDTEAMVFVSYPYLDSAIEQAIDRGIRGVRANPLIVYFLRYTGTVEDRIWEIIHRKNLEAQAIDQSRLNVTR